MMQDANLSSYCQFLAGTQATWAAFWKWSLPHLQGIVMPSCPWKCHLQGTFYKLYKIKSLPWFSQEDSSEASLGTPANLYCRGERMSVEFSLPTQSLQRCMRLHINCIEFGRPWASIAFVLNIPEKYEMEITFSIRAFFSQSSAEMPSFPSIRAELHWCRVPDSPYFARKCLPHLLSDCCSR